MKMLVPGNFREGQLDGAGTVTMPNGDVTVGACLSTSDKKRRLTPNDIEHSRISFHPDTCVFVSHLQLRSQLSLKACV